MKASLKKVQSRDRAGLRTWVEIDTKKAEKNFLVLKKLLGKRVKFGAVTKSNAYGHRLIGYSKLMEKFGVDWILVDSIMEARALRKSGIKPRILVMGYTLPENYALAKNKKVSLTVSSFEGLKTALKDKTLKLHLKFDTGMTRQGFLRGDLPKIFKLLNSKKEFVEGVYTHFAKAKTPDQRNETDAQIEEFEQIVEEFRERGFDPIVHAAATSAVLIFPKSHFDMVRIGIGIYGLWPERVVRKAYQRKLKLEPVLSWKSVVSEVKKVSKGRKVGYDLTYKLKRDAKVAVCPVGYWHGYPRTLSNKSSVLIRGKRARVLGRVSMGMIVLDVTNIKNVRVGDEVVLIGQQGREEVTAEELADLIGTINYEIVTRINPLIKRFYI